MFSPYYENQNTRLLGDDNLIAKRRMMKSQTKKFDPSKARAKKAESNAVKEAKVALKGVEVSDEYRIIFTQGQLAITLLNELKGSLSIRQVSVDSQYSSRILSLIQRLDQIFDTIFNTLRSIILSFNNMTPKQLNDLNNVLNACYNLMLELTDYVNGLPTGAAASSVAATTVREIAAAFEILAKGFDDIVNITDGDGADLFSQLYSQYNYLQPTQAAVNQIRQDAAAVRMARGGNADDDDDSDSDYSPSATATSTSGYVDTDTDDTDSGTDDSGIMPFVGFGRSHMSGGSPLCGCSAYPFAYNTRSVRGMPFGLK